jgi:hypothetical protein
MLSGVPQGFVPGPLLFLLHINDPPDWMKTGIKLFADDTKLWTRMKSYEGTSQLQHNLDSLSQWNDRWQLTLNPDKCAVMHIQPKLYHEYYSTQDDQKWII